ncbi:MAG: hypothetical protein FJ265_22235, partial [Planctomycetes bacterium]|nr:hypothetical protein [Planctomycetota bacterium]
MERSIPEALRRVYQRLLQRDAAGMVAERVSAASIFAGLEWLSRGPIRRLPALPHAAPVFAQLLDEVCSQRSDDCPHRPTTRGDLQFGIGLIAGCHLRDAAERDQ